MKSFFAKIWAAILAKRLENMANNALVYQEKWFHSLIAEAKHTAFGLDHDFASIKSYADFQANIPIRDYEAAKSYFERIYKGEKDVMWKGKPLYLAKTSGTTSGAKYIPITRESIHYQINGARDILLNYIHQTGQADFLSGKMMFLSGSPVLESNAYQMSVGRLSGIVNHFVPQYLQTNRVPSYETNCIEDWETKVRKIVEEVKTQDLRLISGIPPWVQMFFEEAQRQTGKMPLEIWPNLQLFVQGGVDFSPYRPIFTPYLQGKVKILELFPASEGFFAIQNDLADESLLLLCDQGVFYEFIPLSEYGKENVKTLPLSEVKLGEQYAMLVSTNAGLWRYDLGDTVRFTSIQPYKIKVSGRVKHFLSAFGEHIISEEVNKALQYAVQNAGGQVQEFTVAPFVSEQKGESYHEWLIEFSEQPQDLLLFAQKIDESLQQQNVYYKDLRDGNMLKLPQIFLLPLHASREYMKSQGKLGGQNKFPRLSNNRSLAEALRGQ